MRDLAIPFEERLTPFVEGANWNAFREFSPNGRVPCLHDESTVIWDSLAIVEYLAERHPGVWPEESAPRVWARSAVSEMHSGFTELRECCPMNCGLRVELAAMSTTLMAEIARIDEIWAEGRSRFGGPYLSGPRFHAVDAFFAPIAFRVQTFSLPLSDSAGAYVEHLLQHPAMQLWYEAALAENWRETSHENEVAAAGTVLADYRA